MKKEAEHEHRDSRCAHHSGEADHQVKRPAHVHGREARLVAVEVGVGSVDVQRISATRAFTDRGSSPSDTSSGGVARSGEEPVHLGDAGRFGVATESDDEVDTAGEACERVEQADDTVGADRLLLRAACKEDSDAAPDADRQVVRCARAHEHARRFSGESVDRRVCA